METWITSDRGIVLPQFAEIISAYWPHIDYFYRPFNVEDAWYVDHILSGVDEIAFANITEGYPAVFSFEEGNTTVIAPHEHIFELKVAREWSALEDQIDEIITRRHLRPISGDFSQHFPLFAQCFDIIICSKLCRRRSTYYSACINGHYREIMCADSLNDPECTEYVLLARAENFIARWIDLREVIFTLPQPIAEEIFAVCIKHTHA